MDKIRNLLSKSIRTILDLIPVNSKVLNFISIIILEIIFLPLFLLLMILFIICAAIIILGMAIVTIFMSPVAIFKEAKKQILEINANRHKDRVLRKICDKVIYNKTHEEYEYTVCEGDTLESIADKFDCTIDEILYLFEKHQERDGNKSILSDRELNNHTLRLCKTIFVIKEKDTEEE